MDCTVHVLLCEARIYSMLKIICGAGEKKKKEEKQKKKHIWCLKPPEDRTPEQQDNMRIIVRDKQGKLQLLDL